jgi:DNA-directed RNA polymerase subunit RPC12/RpoP
MRKQIYHCQICGLKFKSTIELTGDKPICPGCGEMNRLVALPKGLKRIYARYYETLQIIPADTVFATGSSIKYDGTKVHETGCSRIPTCCGLAIPCDAPPRYCLEHREEQIYYRNQRLNLLPI